MTASVLAQATIVGILIILPMIFYSPLPKDYLKTFLVAPPPPPAAPPPPPHVEHVRVQRPRIIVPNRLVAPTIIPRHVEIVHDSAPALGNSVIGGTGVSNGAPNGILGGLPTDNAPPPPPPPPPPPQPTRIRVGGNVIAAKLVSQALPIYPAIAKTAHVQGTVVLHAIIARDGSVQQLAYVSGPALLMASAMAAVRQWRYKPTYLNGQPVEVDTTIQVVFSLQD